MLFALALLLTAQPVLAAKCSKIIIDVTNRYKKSGEGVAIKGTDIKYYDYGAGKWRDKCIVNKVISYNQNGWLHHCTYPALYPSLSYVGGENTKVIIYFRYDTGRGWSSQYYRTTSRFQCIDKMVIEKTIAN